MHRFAVLHRRRSEDHAKQHRISFPIIGAMLFALLITAVQFFPSNAFAASVAKPALKHVTFTLDGVTVNVTTPFLPGKFVTSKPGAATQAATASTPGFNVHPFGSITIMAVPYGTQPTTEGVPVAQAGGAQAYRSSLYQYRLHTGDTSQAGPIASLFGQKVASMASFAKGSTTVAYSSTIIVEWVVEAGKRIWIVRMVNEQPAGTIGLSSADSFLASLNSVTLTSSTLTHSTTVNPKKAVAGVAPAVLSNYPTPPWWNGTCSNNSSTSAPGSPTSTTWPASWNGLYACYTPSNVSDWNITFNAGGMSGSLSEWECVELSMRYMLLSGYITSTYPAGGKDVVGNYSKYGNTKLVAVNNNSGTLPQIGDILSYAATSTNPNGHTSVVISTSYSTGTIRVLQQNSANPSTGAYIPEENLNVSSNGNVTTIGWSDVVTGWLHDPGTGGSSGGGTSTVNSQDVFAVGANGHLLDYHWQYHQPWTTSDIGTANGVLLTGTPTSGDFMLGSTHYEHILVTGSDGHLYEFYRTVGASTWTVNNDPPPSGVNFVGSPDGFTYTGSDGKLHYSVSLVGNNGHLYDEDWVVGVSITITDLTATVGPSGVSFTGATTSGDFMLGSTHYEHILAIGSDGHLYEFYRTVGASTWTVNNDPPPSGVNFVGSPNGFMYTGSDKKLHYSVSMLGNDSHLYNEDWIVGVSITTTDLTATVGPSGVTFTGTPSGNAFYDSATQVEDEHTLVVGSDGHLYEYWRPVGGTWGVGDLNSVTGASFTVTSSPMSQSFVIQGQTSCNHTIYVDSSDGHLQEFFWNQTSWSASDLGLPPGTTLNGNSPNAAVYTS